jgi:hypothetical protein
VEVILTPRAEGNAVKLDADIGNIEADGSLGEMLRSGSLARLSHLEGVRAHKSNGMSNGCTKVFTTKAELN